MIRWDLTTSEVRFLQSTLHLEISRLGQKKDLESVKGRMSELTRLLSSLKRATQVVSAADIICYCDTNYIFSTRTLAISYRIGDDKAIHQESVLDVPPPPDEYLGVLTVLRELQKRETTGKVLIMLDASRCAIALQSALKYSVPNHSKEQAPTRKEYERPTYFEAVDLTKALLTNGCHVEYTFKHRNYINEALGIR
jgi:hypothetical protein